MCCQTATDKSTASNPPSSSQPPVTPQEMIGSSTILQQGTSQVQLITNSLLSPSQKLRSGSQQLHVPEKHQKKQSQPLTVAAQQQQQLEECEAEVYAAPLPNGLHQQLVQVNAVQSQQDCQNQSCQFSQQRQRQQVETSATATPKVSGSYTSQLLWLQPQLSGLSTMATSFLMQPRILSVSSLSLLSKIIYNLSLKLDIFQASYETLVITWGQLLHDL